MILLDTNIISETLRRRPDRHVVAWLDAQTSDSLFLPAPVLAEMYFGMALLPEGTKREFYAAAAARIESKVFLNRILPFDAGAAREYGRIVAHRRQIGRPIEQMDAFIASIAALHRASLATRDFAGFTDLGLDLINPFVPAA